MLFQGVFIIVSNFTENINNPVGVLSHKMLPKINVAFSEKGKDSLVPGVVTKVVTKENLGKGELQMLQMRKMLSSGLRISNSFRMLKPWLR